MSLRDEWRRARFGAGIVRYLAEPPGNALAEVRARVQARDSTFLALARNSMFGHARSPHAALLRWAGWDYPRLERSIARVGLEETLGALRADGVWTSADEFKARHPIRRQGLLIEPRQADFDHPHARGSSLRATTSGTAARGRTQVPYRWKLFREEAALEALLFEAHGLADAPCALWLPGPPSISGIHNLLVHMGFRCPPERWFAHLPARGPDAVALRGVQVAGAAFGMRVPLPEPTSFDQGDRVALWMASAREREGAAVLKTFATSAVRVAEAARRRDLDLGGCVFFAGGEPLTERRRAYVESTGARVHARYVATETGWIAGACPASRSPAAMHLYSDRLAVVPAAPDRDESPLLFTTISESAGKLLLNTDLGDAGRLDELACGCPLGRAGLRGVLSGVHGYDKVSGEGMTLALASIAEVLDQVIVGAGGAPDSYQLCEEEDAAGAWRLVIVLSPSMTAVREAELADRLLDRLPEHGPAAELAATFWRESGAVEVRRAHPELTNAQKRTTVAATATPALRRLRPSQPRAAGQGEGLDEIARPPQGA